jgi:hypothetical protein
MKQLPLFAPKAEPRPAEKDKPVYCTCCGREIPWTTHDEKGLVWGRAIFRQGYCYDCRFSPLGEMG